MNKKIKIAFLLMVLVQALHSLEEYYGKLWEVYAPAKFITGLVSNENEAGFVVINISLFIAGIFIWSAYVTEKPFAKLSILFLSIMEIINSVGHSIWAVMEKSYVPGVATAPMLFVLALYLIARLLKTSRTTQNLSAV